MSRNALIGIALLAITCTAVGQDVHRVGKQSCASATCHGNRVAQGPIWNHSLSTFTARDPHALAGQVLLSERSQRMVALLSPGTTLGTDRYANVLRDRCISCHTTVSASDLHAAGPVAPDVLADGVSCESCHGPAGDWLERHTNVSFVGERRFAESSFRDTESIIGRTDVCTPCHLGSRRQDGLIRDMNHDLIAAGHPPLRFDLLTYTQNLPKHWEETKFGWFDSSQIRVRRVSNAIQVAQAAALSQQRAADNEHTATIPWPELSEFDCFACHQSLRAHSPRTALSEISDGIPDWMAVRLKDPKTRIPNSRPLTNLRDWQQSRELAKTTGQLISHQYRTLAEELQEKSFDALEEIRFIVEDTPSQRKIDWHSAAAIYLELSAAVADAVRSGQLADADAATSGLRHLELLLRFNPPDASGATSADADSFDSPAEFQSSAFSGAIEEHFQPLVSAR